MSLVSGISFKCKSSLDPSRAPRFELKTTEAWESDLGLVHQALQGSEVAQHVLAVRLRCVETMCTHINSKRNGPLNAHDLEDLIQSTKALIWERLRSFNGTSKLGTWVYTYCIYGFLYASKKKKKKKKKRNPVELHEMTAQELVSRPNLEQEHRREDIRNALSHLPQVEFEVVRLKHFLDFTFEEIATQRSIPINTAKSRYYRALERLRRWLQAPG